MKILKNAKALSPVVASIILIAVTVAVSIAVGVWMFGLTGSFMGSAEQLKVANVVFGNNTGTLYFNMTLMNPSPNSITVNEIWVGTTKITTTTPALPITVPSNNQTQVYNIGFTWSPGASYEVKVLTSKGNQIIYPCTAPYSS